MDETSEETGRKVLKSFDLDLSADAVTIRTTTHSESETEEHSESESSEVTITVRVQGGVGPASGDASSSSTSGQSDTTTQTTVNSTDNVTVTAVTAGAVEKWHITIYAVTYEVTEHWKFRSKYQCTICGAIRYGTWYYHSQTHEETHVEVKREFTGEGEKPEGDGDVMTFEEYDDWSGGPVPVGPGGEPFDPEDHESETTEPLPQVGR